MNCIITAAGKSSRFDTKKSKVLFKINKETIIEKIYKKVRFFSKKTIIVCNNKNIKEIQKILKKYKHDNIVYRIQKNPTGMATAISEGLEQIQSKNFFIIWADMIYLKKNTIKKTINLHVRKKNILTFPYYKIKNPYTLIIEDKNGKFVNILQKREGEFSYKIGKNDCGFFVCNTKKIKKELIKLIKNQKIITKKTKEFDFLKSFKHFVKLGSISFIKASSKHETRGINSKKDILK
jgi:bifunctional N-acetylglucosamine-1-phosphate-uridyltransferase/glucosamine-1-phosphate-acetyltransferase GlmU-like protein